VRLVAATNVNLLEAMEKKAFREDLFSRLNVITLNLPPLREREEDVPLLAHHFLEVFKRKNNKNLDGFKREAMEVMLQYPWPRNVRQLENAIERAVVLARGENIVPEDLPPEILKAVYAEGETQTITLDDKRISVRLGTPLEEIERQVIEGTLKFSKGDKNIASKILGISSRTIYRKIEGEKGEEKEEITGNKDDSLS
jgi:two-component system, NtrC family, response regulator HydG